MTTTEIKSTLAELHTHIADLLASEAEARLRETLVPDQWNVLDVIAHINSWGLIFLGDMRYMARHPGRPIPYTLPTTTRYDAENEALVVRRRGWAVAQYAEENRQLSAALAAFVDSFGGELPQHPVEQPWQGVYDIAGVLAYHARHGQEHLQDIRAALGRS